MGMRADCPMRPHAYRCESAGVGAAPQELPGAAAGEQKVGRGSRICRPSVACGRGCMRAQVLHPRTGGLSQGPPRSQQCCMLRTSMFARLRAQPCGFGNGAAASTRRCTHIHTRTHAHRLALANACMPGMPFHQPRTHTHTHTCTGAPTLCHCQPHRAAASLAPCCCGGGAEQRGAGRLPGGRGAQGSAGQVSCAAGGAGGPAGRAATWWRWFAAAAGRRRRGRVGACSSRGRGTGAA